MKFQTKLTKISVILPDPKRLMNLIEEDTKKRIFGTIFSKNNIVN